MSHQLSDIEVLDVIGQMLEALKQPDPDPMVFRILESLPLTRENVTSLMGALACSAAGITLEAAGINDGDMARISLIYALPPEDISDHHKTAAELVRMGCDFLLAPDGDEGPAQVLNMAVVAAVGRSPVHTFLTLGELLAHIRRLLVGDTRGVIRA